MIYLDYDQRFRKLENPTNGAMMPWLAGGFSILFTDYNGIVYLKSCENPGEIHGKMIGIASGKQKKCANWVKAPFLRTVNQRTT